MTSLPRPGDGITVMPLTAFLAAATPCYADTWDELVTWATDDPVEADIVERLRGEWRTAGTFKLPVRVDDTGQLANGRHRVTASILEHAATIHVTADDHDDDGPTVEIDLRVELPDSTTVSAEDLDALVDLVLGAARSFPVDAAWAETDGASLHHDEVHLIYRWDPDDAAALADALVKRLAMFQVTATVLYTGAGCDPLEGPSQTVGAPAPA